VIALRWGRSRSAGPCPGCPIYPHIRDRDLRFPSCELCHRPAVGVGGAHVWRCAFCRHPNEHGSLRPLVSVALLRLAAIEDAALRLPVDDARCGRYLSTPPWPVTRRPRIRSRAGGPGGLSGPGRRPAARVVRRRPGPLQVRPVYARAAVGGLPVLIVGGDRHYPHPLGGNEPVGVHRPLSSRATRIACPCRQRSPCPHAQALYAHVVRWGAGPADAQAPGRRWPGPPGSPEPVGATRKVSRSQAVWLTIRAPSGMPAADSADQ
jgi:hypothetical protein